MVTEPQQKCIKTHEEKFGNLKKKIGSSSVNQLRHFEASNLMALS